METQSTPSPVTWHVAFWVLLTITINSMAQRAAFAFDHTLYAYSSPLLCLAETMHQLLYISIVSIKLHIWPTQAAHIAYQMRMKALNQEKKNLSHSVNPSMWPRWLFFIMGTLPAVIKLCSFTGTPWTQVLGMMALSSFLTNEFIYLATLMVQQSDDTRDIFQAKGHEADLRGTPSNELYDRLHAIFSRTKVWTFRIAWILHCFFLSWVAIQLFMELRDETVTRSEGFEWFIIIFCYPVNILSIIAIALPNLATLLSRVFPALRRKITRFDFDWHLTDLVIPILGSCSSAFFITLPESDVRFMNVFLLVLSSLNFIPAYNDYVKLVCRIFPGIGRAFFLMEDVAEEVHEGTDGQQQDPGEFKGTAHYYFLFFVVNLVVCVLWYALKYDPSGTINPAWTDVFG